jgi:hypothetical protein
MKELLDKKGSLVEQMFAKFAKTLSQCSNSMADVSYQIKASQEEKKEQIYVDPTDALVSAVSSPNSPLSVEITYSSSPSSPVLHSALSSLENDQEDELLNVDISY